MRTKVAITLTTFAKCSLAPLDILKERGVEVVNNTLGRKLNGKEIVELCSGCIGIVAGTETYDGDILGKLPDVKVISRCGAGLDNIDLDAAKKIGISVLNTPDAPTHAVAELAVGLLLSLLRKVNQMDRLVKKGKWEKLTGNLLYGKKVGIIGFGRIGQRVGELVSIFGAEFAYYDIEDKSSTLDCSKKGFEEILGWADILTLHVSFSEQSEPIMGRREINLMKKGSWLINLSRGGVVDEEALCNALKEGHLSGAAVDVFTQEPYTGPLRELSNTILTPHIGSYAKEARIKMEIEAVKNLLRGLEALA